MCLLVAGYFAVPLLWRSLLWLLYPPVRVSYAMPLAGRVTGSSMNRHYYLQLLDGSTYRYYDFNGFVPAASRAEWKNLSNYVDNEFVLGAHLREGDYLRKAANTTTLMVQHGDSTSYWQCEPAD